MGLLACQVACYLNKLDALLLDSTPQLFLVKSLQSVAAGLVLTMLLTLIYPGLFPGYRQALFAALLATLSLVVMRPLARSQQNRACQ